MRYIHKQAEPKELAYWKNQANEDWEPDYDKLSRNAKEAKRAVFNSLLSEQGHICCYCERELAENDYHIEHLIPRSLSPELDLNYSNFLCSCIANPAKGKPIHCGHLKKDREIPIHPLQSDCQSKFTFTPSGEIYGINTDAKETIEILGLNIAKLIDLRRQALSPFLEDETISNQEFQKFVSGYLHRGSDGKHNPFISSVADVFNFAQ